jgi:hypothetical protein
VGARLIQVRLRLKVVVFQTSATVPFIVTVYKPEELLAHDCGVKYVNA